MPDLVPPIREKVAATRRAETLRRLQAFLKRFSCFLLVVIIFS
jgi:hypothetical protein